MPLRNKFSFVLDEHLGTESWGHSEVVQVMKKTPLGNLVLKALEMPSQMYSYHQVLRVGVSFL